MILPEFFSIHRHSLCKSTLYQECRETAHDTSTTAQQQHQWETRNDDRQRTILTWRQRPHTSLGFINGSPNVILAHQTSHTHNNIRLVASHWTACVLVAETE